MRPRHKAAENLREADRNEIEALRFNEAAA